jgi:ABC-type sugar transport system ATPase subunit
MESILELNGITKRFGATTALDAVSVSFAPGTVHGLCGENGAGKSTMGKVVTGVHQPDEGAITLRGNGVVVANPRRALEMGISMTHQETLFVPELTVTENVLMTTLPLRGHLPLITWKRAYDSVQSLLDELSMDIDAKARMRDLSVAETVMVSIARAVYYKSDVIVLDEPTASFNFNEVDLLFRLIRKLRARGALIIFISHRLKEVLAVTDWVSVLRDGQLVGTAATSTLDEEQLTVMMCGRELAKRAIRDEEIDEDTPLLSVRKLCTGSVFRDVSLELHPGEILGIAGLLGSGKDELIHALITGSYDSGELFVRGEKRAIRSPRESQKAGMGYVPADRHLQGLVPVLSVRENVYLRAPVGWAALTRHGLERRLARAVTDRTHLVAPRGIEQAVGTLSGGNQQKVLMSRILALDPEILILHEPTRGIDVGAKAEIHNLMREIAGTGKGILMCSSETEEIIALSDRVLVMNDGRVAAEFAGDEINEDAVVRASLTK